MDKFLDDFKVDPSAEQTRVKTAPFGETCCGRRPENQDMLLIYIYPENLGLQWQGGVFAVADGVGGEVGGKDASEQLVREIFGFASKRKFVTQEDLRRIDNNLRSGATTLVLAQSIRDGGNSYRIYSVGDSSALLVDEKRQEVKEITRRDEDLQGRVTQVMGPAGRNKAPLKTIHEVSVSLDPGQTLLLATDGFTRYMDKGRILPANILTVRQKYRDSVAFVRQLIHMADVEGASDNITLVCVPYMV